MVCGVASRMAGNSIKLLALDFFIAVIIAVFAVN